MDKQKRKKLNEKLKDFIFAQTSEVVNFGLIYSLSYDKAFLIENLELKNAEEFKKKNKYLKQKLKMDSNIFDLLAL